MCLKRQTLNFSQDFNLGLLVTSQNLLLAEPSGALALEHRNTRELLSRISSAKLVSFPACHTPSFSLLQYEKQAKLGK